MNGESVAMAVGAKALDGLFMRMAAIAQNIANVNSPGFQPMGVKFEDALAKAANSGTEAVDALRFEFTAGRPYAASEDRRTDLMIADAATTSMRYSALVDMLSRRLALREGAIGGAG